MAPDAKGSRQKVNGILEKYGRDKSMLVPVLQDVQAEYRYLPREALEQVSHGLEVPLTRVYSVATFFKAFSLTPRGKHQVNVCMGTACHVRGSVKVLDEMQKLLRLKSGGTTPDLKFSLDTVNCVGACALGPIVIVDEDYHGGMNPDKAGKILKAYT
ncbi:MAG: NAD(P)H-dependent oxidoreductase subunit E [Chloroflexota bacterium]